MTSSTAGIRSCTFRTSLRFSAGDCLSQKDCIASVCLCNRAEHTEGGSIECSMGASSPVCSTWLAFENACSTCCFQILAALPPAFAHPPLLAYLASITSACRFMKMLKPGGKLLISDYCRAPQAPSEGFAAYIKQRGYDLHPVADYAAMLQAAGFVEVVGEDRTWQVCCSLLQCYVCCAEQLRSVCVYTILSGRLRDIQASICMHHGCYDDMSFLIAVALTMQNCADVD